jgi:hypothetical protein
LSIVYILLLCDFTMFIINDVWSFRATQTELEHTKPPALFWLGVVFWRSCLTIVLFLNVHCFFFFSKFCDKSLFNFTLTLYVSDLHVALNQLCLQLFDLDRKFLNFDLFCILNYTFVVEQLFILSCQVVDNLLNLIISVLVFCNKSLSILDFDVVLD